MRQNTHATAFEVIEIGQRLGITGLVVDDDQFQIRVVGLGQPAFHASVQQLIGVPGRVDEADLGQALGQGPMGTQGTRQLGLPTQAGTWA